MVLDLGLIEPEMDCWVEWLADEAKNVRKRFGDDEESLEFFPDDYYEKLEKWWMIEANRLIDPVDVKFINGIYRIEDGWHRVAISHKLGLAEIPVRLKS